MCVHFTLALGSALGRSVAAVGWIGPGAGSMRLCVTLLLSAAAGQLDYFGGSVCVRVSLTTLLN